jgi:hypothetical protein
MPPDTIALLAPKRAKHLPRFRRAAVDDRPAFRLTDRDREALRLVYDNRWITAEMLQDLVSPLQLTDRQKDALNRLKAKKKATAAGPPQPIKREIRRRLQLMYHHGYVQRQKLADGEPIAYALGNKGADELALYFGIERKQIDWTTKNRECGERYIRHALMVTGFRHALEVSLRATPDLHLTVWAPGGAFEEKVKYLDTVRTRDGTKTQVVEGTVKPDALFKISQGAKGDIAYFLETDRSSMSNARRYMAKLKAYYAFWKTYVEPGKSPIKQMRVLTITISEERRKNIRKNADEVIPGAKGLFWFLCEKAYLASPRTPQEVLGAHWQTLEDDTFKPLYP